MNIAKGYLKEFLLKKDGILQLRVNIWKETLPEEFLKAIQTTEDGFDIEISLLTLKGSDRDEWLKSKYPFEDMLRCLKCSSLSYLMETKKGIFCEKCLDELAQETKKDFSILPKCKESST